jgi:hypothetical protein
MVDGMGATLSFQDALNETGRMSSITAYSETPTLWHTQASEGEVRLYRVTARQIKWDIPDEIRDPPHDVDFPETPPPRTNLSLRIQRSLLLLGALSHLSGPASTRVPRCISSLSLREPFVWRKGVLTHTSLFLSHRCFSW